MFYYWVCVRERSLFLFSLSLFFLWGYKTAVIYSVCLSGTARSSDRNFSRVSCPRKQEKIFSFRLCPVARWNKSFSSQWRKIVPLNIYISLMSQRRRRFHLEPVVSLLGRWNRMEKPSLHVDVAFNFLYLIFLSETGFHRLGLCRTLARSTLFLAVAFFVWSSSWYFCFKNPYF